MALKAANSLAIGSGWAILKVRVQPMREMKCLAMEAPPLERRLAVILAADVEGYGRLMHDDEEATLATLSARRSVLDELTLRHKGRIANTAGDSVLAEFASVLDAVRCAVDIQEALAQANESEPETRHIRFRIGCGGWRRGR